MDDSDDAARLRAVLEANRQVLASTNPAVSTAGRRIAAIVTDLLLDVDVHLDDHWALLEVPASTSTEIKA